MNSQRRDGFAVSFVGKATGTGVVNTQYVAEKRNGSVELIWPIAITFL